MKSYVSNARVGKTSTPMKMSGNGAGTTKRDSAVATGTPAGGATKHIDRTKGQHLKRSSGSFAKYGK